MKSHPCSGRVTEGEGQTVTAVASAGFPIADRQSNVIGRYPLTSYFVLAFAGAWAVFLVHNLSADAWGVFSYASPFDIIVYIAAATFLGPMLAAVIVTGAAQGKAGVVHFFKRFLIWRVGVRWYVWALLGVPVLATVGALLVPGVLASFTPIDPVPSFFSYVVFFVWPALIIGGPLGEEPGWRGFALPRLEDRYGPILGTLIVGVLWGVWHATIWSSGEWTVPTWQNMVMFTVWITAISVIYTWIYNCTQGSILFAILVHASMDAFPNAVLFPMFPALGEMTDAGILTAYIANTIGYGGAALVIIVATRGRLGLPAREPAPA
jgi:membrane protease YdiL (CAAX protease family)